MPDSPLSDGENKDHQSYLVTIPASHDLANEIDADDEAEEDYESEDDDDFSIDDDVTIVMYPRPWKEAEPSSPTLELASSG